MHLTVQQLSSPIISGLPSPGWQRGAASVTRVFKMWVLADLDVLSVVFLYDRLFTVGFSGQTIEKTYVIVGIFFF